jgi:hypothetical protein
VGFYFSEAAAEDRPLQYLTLDCLFRGQSNTTLEQGKLVRTIPKDMLAITLTSFDYAKGTAIMIGNSGSDEASFIPSYKKATLIQFSATGNAVVTSFSEPKDGRAIAFHSRHIWMIGEPIVSEYQGDCIARK